MRRSHASRTSGPRYSRDERGSWARSRPRFAGADTPTEPSRRTCSGFAASSDFCRGQDPRTLGATEVKTFLEHLAVRRNVAATTQNQALSALVFLYRNVLDQDLELGAFRRAKRPRHLPVVLTRQEVRALLGYLGGTSNLMASLLYGAGMRLMEVVRLRIKDVDFEYAQIAVRNAKGAKDRVVPLPQATVVPLRAQLARVRDLFDEDRTRGLSGVFLPDALASKYPNAGKEWIWQFVFPSGRVSTDPRSGVVRRHHIHENGLQKAVKAAAVAASILKKVSCHPSSARRVRRAAPYREVSAAGP